MAELENCIRTQNEEYFKLFDYIEDQVPYANQIKILTTNEQVVPVKGVQVSQAQTQIQIENRFLFSLYYRLDAASVGGYDLLWRFAKM